MQVYHVVVGYVLASTAIPTALHASLHGFSALQCGLAFFVGLNALICYWEVALAYRIDHIHKAAESLRSRTADTQSARFAAVGDFLGRAIVSSRGNFSINTEISAAARCFAGQPHHHHLLLL